MRGAPPTRVPRADQSYVAACETHSQTCPRRAVGMAPDAREPADQPPANSSAGVGDANCALASKMHERCRLASRAISTAADTGATPNSSTTDSSNRLSK